MKLISYTFTLFSIAFFTGLSAQNGCWTTTTGNIGNSSIFTCNAGKTISTADTLYIRHAVTIGSSNNQTVNFSSYALSVIALQNNSTITPYGANNELSLPVNAKIVINSGSSVVQPNNQSQGTAINIPNNSSSICVWGTKCCTGNQSVVGPGLLINTSPCNFAVPLPVHLLNFTGESKGNATQIQWTVSGEKNFKHYEIMRSSDGINFQSIALVESQNTAVQIKNYAFSDLNPLQGHSFYQLKMVDLDGSSTSSQILLVQQASKDINGVAQIYPNPADQQIQIDLSGSPLHGNVQIKVFSMNGQEVLVKEQVASENSIFDIQTDGFEQGLYLIQISDENGLVSINRFRKL